MFYTHTHTHNLLRERRERTGLVLLPPMTSAKGGLRRKFSHIEGRAD